MPSEEDEAKIKFGNSKMYKIKSVWLVDICNIILKLFSLLLYILIVLSPEHEHKFPDFNFIIQLHHFLWDLITRIHLNVPFLLIVSLSDLLSSIFFWFNDEE